MLPGNFSHPILAVAGSVAQCPLYGALWTGAELYISARLVVNTFQKLLAQKHGCKYFETSAIRNDQVPEAFSSLIARIVAQIPNPPEPSLLLRKRIQIGKSLAENKSFRAALFDLA